MYGKTVRLTMANDNVVDIWVWGTPDLDEKEWVRRAREMLEYADAKVI